MFPCGCNGIRFTMSLTMLPGVTVRVASVSIGPGAMALIPDVRPAEFGRELLCQAVDAGFRESVVIRVQPGCCGGLVDDRTALRSHVRYLPPGTPCSAPSMLTLMNFR